MEYPSDEDYDLAIIDLAPKASTLTKKKSNFRLNYNPYNLKKSEEMIYDKKQMKLLRKMALEVPNKNADKLNNNDSQKNLNSFINLDTEERKLAQSDFK